MNYDNKLKKNMKLVHYDYQVGQMKILRNRIAYKYKNKWWSMFLESRWINIEKVIVDITDPYKHAGVIALP